MSAVALYGLLLKAAGSGTICVFKNMTGVPCPSCGMTRSAQALLRCDIPASLYWHPLLLPAVLAAAAVLLRRKAFFSHLYKSKAYWFCTAAAFTAVYIWRMVTLFPRTAPMDYSGHNALAALFRFISHLF